MGRVVIPGFRKIETSGGGEGGTSNYNDLANKPSINNVPLVGNLKTVDLKLTDATLTEEGVPAEAKTVGTKLEEQSTSLTALSEQLGNHTVKSDVPENAVFTDTVYDDTEVKESIDELNSNLNELGNAIDGLNSDSYWEQGTWNVLGQKVDTPTIIRTKEKLILPIDYSVSLVNSNYVYEVDYYENEAYKNNTGWISDLTIIPKGQEFALLIRKVDTSDLVPTERNAISVLPKNIGTINESLSVIGKCKNLLNPTLQTTTINGITCTTNGDGTYTLNGTSTGDAFFDLIPWSEIAVGNYRVVGCPIGGSKDGYFIEINAPKTNEINTYYQDIGNGVTFEVYDKTEHNNIIIRIKVNGGTTVSNLVFKPMLTTNLNTTYDDFVPYTGDGETLTHDVAEIKNDLDKLNSLPIGSIIQIEAAKDNIETTTQKYGWQYLGTSNIECNDGSVKLLVTNVYRKNN